MQEGGCAHDLQVGALQARQALSQVIDAQHVVEAVYRIVFRIPEAGGFDGGHTELYPHPFLCLPAVGRSPTLPRKRGRGM